MSTNLPPLSVQLYSLREACAEDFDGVLEQLAQVGFKGVEPFHLFGKTPQAFKQQVNALGMQVSSTHTPWVNRTEDINEVVDTVQALGLNRAAGGYMPEDFADFEALQRTIDQTAAYVDALRPHGLSLFLHNHYWEFAEIEGRTAYHYLQDAVADVEFEIDTYWAANFGNNDPAAELARVRARTPLIHVKDGPLQPGQSHVAAGSGSMDIPAVFAAADPDVLEWAIVELDACDTDMMEAVAASYTYLTRNNLAQGNV